MATSIVFNYGWTLCDITCVQSAINRSISYALHVTSCHHGLLEHGNHCKQIPQFTETCNQMCGLLCIVGKMEAEVIHCAKQKPYPCVNADGDKNNSSTFYGELEAEIDLNSVSIVELKIFTNWGHPSRVGLTEVQVLDANKKPFVVESIKHGDDIPVLEERGHLENLVNGKFKTVKEKFMWSCELHADKHPIELVFCIRTLASHSNESRKIRWVGIWNFNKGLKDLSIGAKHIEIHVNGTIAYSGFIEKACGNQIFEYGQFLLLSMQEEPRYKAKSSSMPRRSQINQNNLNYQKGADNYETDNCNLEVGERLTTRVSDSPISMYRCEATRDYPANSASERQRNFCAHKPSWFDEFEPHNMTRERTMPSWLKDFKIDVKQAIEKPGDEGIGVCVRGDPCFTGDTSYCATQHMDRTTSLTDNGLFRSKSRNEPLSVGSHDDCSGAGARDSCVQFGRRAISACNARGKNAKAVQSGYTDFHEKTATLEESLTSLRFLKENMKDAEFIIPELPEGIHLVMNIKSTWGDKHYVGLNGIELFDRSGMPVTVSEIWADPADINVLPEYSEDPRVVTNLINGIYRTKDDTNLWLAPFTPGRDHLIYMTFEKQVKIALIRIWNYNKSRIHSHRGARDVEMLLDGSCIFRGEIAKACGAIIGETEAFGDTILFTLDDSILESISKNDVNFLASDMDENEEDEQDNLLNRPHTGNCVSSSERPRTNPVIKNACDDEATLPGIIGKCLEIKLLSNWGDAAYVGLTAIEVVGEDDEAIDLDDCEVTISEASAEHSLNRIFDGHNITTDPKHMWMTHLTRTPQTISLCLAERQVLTGLRVWNYNASLEESYRGVQSLAITIDGHHVCPSADAFIVRRAPGNCHFDFNQYLSFTSSAFCKTSKAVAPRTDPLSTSLSRTSSSCQEYEPLVMPKGFVFQLQLLSTWGDSYYVGLNGLEIYDDDGKEIQLTEGEVAAYPDSVNVLEGIRNDVRTPDKLVDGVNDSRDGRHTWLAPILPGIINRVYVIFDYPVTVSMIKLWNYAKTPSRGVKEFAVVVDDLLVYHGVLAKTVSSVSHRSILFTSDARILQSEGITTVKNEGIDQDVQMTNDSQIIHKSQSSDPIDQALRPFTSLPPKSVSKISHQTKRIVS